jgi:GGDEF domain-containing protein
VPAWALVAAASIAAAAGIGAVALASEVLAVIGGTASAVTALLALDGRLAARRAAAADEVPPTPPPEAPVALEPAGDDDPIRALFESGPPAGGSGLLSEHFLSTTLRGRVTAARNALRPMALVLFEVLETEGGRATVPVAVDEVAPLVRRSLRDTDLAGHAGPGTFACILEDTSEDGAVWTAERLRRRLGEGHERRFHAGVAAYPSHGLTAEELEEKAQAALVAARDWATDRIEVAGSS